MGTEQSAFLAIINLAKSPKLFVRKHDRLPSADAKVVWGGGGG